MSDSACKALYEAQMPEHELTPRRLREAERDVIALRGELIVVRMEREKAVRMLQTIASSISEVYPPARNVKE